MEVAQIEEFVFLKDVEGKVVAKMFLTYIDGRIALIVKHPAGLPIHVEGIGDENFQASCQEFLTKYHIVTK